MVAGGGGWTPNVRKDVSKNVPTIGCKDVSKTKSDKYTNWNQEGRNSYL